jgi:hypothetical protein
MARPLRPCRMDQDPRHTKPERVRNSRLKWGSPNGNRPHTTLSLLIYRPFSFLGRGKTWKAGDAARAGGLELRARLDPLQSPENANGLCAIASTNQHLREAGATRRPQKRVHADLLAVAMFVCGECFLIRLAYRPPLAEESKSGSLSHLEQRNRLPKLLAAGPPMRTRCGRRRCPGVLLVSMLLKRRMWL